MVHLTQGCTRLLDCISRDDRTGMNYLYGMGYVTSLVGEKKIQVNNCFNLGRFISLSPNCTCNYS